MFDSEPSYVARTCRNRLNRALLFYFDDFYSFKGSSAIASYSNYAISSDGNDNLRRLDSLLHYNAKHLREADAEYASYVCTIDN